MDKKGERALVNFPQKSRVEKKTVYLRREKDHEQDATEAHG